MIRWKVDNFEEYATASNHLRISRENGKVISSLSQIPMDCDYEHLAEVLEAMLNQIQESIEKDIK